MARLLWPRQGEPDALLFVGPLGNRLDPGWLWRRVLEPAREAAGLPWVTFHSLRHTCASMLFAAGKNPKQVQMWLGHSDPGFTLRTYVHLIDDGLGDADFFDSAKWGAVEASSTLGDRRRPNRQHRVRHSPLRDTGRAMSGDLDLVRSIYADWERCQAHKARAARIE